MRYTLRQLEVFLAVARTGSVSRAGQELALSQSATSSSLADLERQFDVQLFDRMGKRLRLSTRGAALRARAEAVLEQARDLERGFESRAIEHRVRVGATLTIGNYVAVPLVARFMRDASGDRPDAGGRQHGADRPPGGELRAGRRPRRGRGRSSRPRDHALARRPAGRLLRRAPSPRAKARAHRRGPAGGRLDRPRARLGHAAGVRPGDARPRCPSSRWR